MNRLDRALRIVLAALMAIAIVDLLIGVFFRYVVTQITAYLDLDMVHFSWVDEVGELALAWMAPIGAAVGIRDRVHFTLHLGVQRLPIGVQRAIALAIALLIVMFGTLVAWHGWGISMLNASLTSPALEISLAWLYQSAVLGGVLIALYGLASMRDVGHRGPL
ncbi:MAG: TRAP transporter small permease [Proteobacteria bacterium]|nr:TRAP transporter small permease [Pseudomonadota bacterium]